jgi:ABC-type sugar transport system permease subunit
MYQPDQGLINNLIGHAQHNQINWLGDSNINIYAVLVAAGWRHTGYIMLLYLAGLKAVDPALKEAAALDGANAWQAFTRVTFPVLRPVNIVVLVVTVIEALRAFDIVYIINKGRNGLELLSVLVTDNIIGESSRIGWGSALAVILLLISLGFIITYLIQVFRKDARA